MLQTMSNQSRDRPPMPNRQSSTSIPQSRHGIRMSDLDMDRTSAAEALGLLAVSITSPNSLAQSEIRVASQGTSSSSGNSVNNSSQGYPLLFPLGPSITPTLQQLTALLPPPHELDILINEFLFDLSFLPLVHAPTFRERYRNFDASSTRNDPFFVALLLAISGWQTHWRMTDPRVGRSESGGDISGGRNYLQAALDTLHLAG